ncbi:unnamed protein product [Malus baccata var. baccata]
MDLVRTTQGTSSYSNSRRGYHYDVFLSFRGEDTRKTFTDHLYEALTRAGYRTFRDDDELEMGEKIKSGLEQAIQMSRASIIVFSKNYASSRWCLNELVEIVDHKRTSSDHVVIPVFYDVDPSHVRKQTGSFAEAFARHRKTEPPDMMERWRKALEEVADLAGKVLQNQAYGYESKFIKDIVKVIRDKLSRTHLSVESKLVGIHSRVEHINLWLQDPSHDVGILLIYGLPGIGKTTIAKCVYNSNFESFEGSSYVENIRETASQPNGLVRIQKKILYDILKGEKEKIQCVSEGIIKIGRAISFTRVLLVLDDVDHMDQLDAVLRMKDQFYPGSKIIITTRRKRLLKAHEGITVHEVGPLGFRESLDLLTWHAFGQDHPLEGYEKYSEQVAQHSGRLPLAVKVLGSSLFGEPKRVWKSTLEKLEVIPNDEIMNTFRISYDSLQDDHDQKLFLHIACFFIGKDEDYIVRILNGCDFYTIRGIQNLIDRCLVTIDRDKKLYMHDMIRDMGRGIVRRESYEPGNRSRLWRSKDSFEVLREKKGTQAIEDRSSTILSSFPCSLVKLSMKGCNLSDDAFCRDLSSLSSLRRLKLGENPICSLPGFIKGLRRLDKLSFKGCNRLESLVGVDVEMIKLLGLCNLGSLPAIRMNSPFGCSGSKEDRWSPVQGLYEFGIFSTFFTGNEVPGQFSYKSNKSSIFFIVPLLLASHRIQGLNIFATYAKKENSNNDNCDSCRPILTKVSNKSKGLKWIYGPEFYGIPGHGEDMIWLSHWRMETETILQYGDEVDVSVMTPWLFLVKEFGVELVQEHQNNMMISTQHNTKSDPDYPFVIGGDLSMFEHRPGIYFLCSPPKELYDNTNFHGSRWLNRLIMDSGKEDTDKEGGQEDEPDYTIAKMRPASNNCSLGRWKVLLTAAGFFFTLALVVRSSISQKKKRQ